MLFLDLIEAGIQWVLTGLASGKTVLDLVLSDCISELTVQAVPLGLVAKDAITDPQDTLICQKCPYTCAL